MRLVADVGGRVCACRMNGAQGNGSTEPKAFAGWCPNCGIESAIVEIDASGNAWATCTECESGWISRDDDGGSSIEAVSTSYHGAQRAAA